MRVVVTGVAGFIGSHVAQHMLDWGWQVCGIDDLTGGSQANVPESVEFFTRDCCQPLDDIFNAFEPTAVVHLAAYAAEGLSHHIPNFNYWNNVVGTTNVLSAAFRAGVEHFVFASSIAVYGHPQGAQILTEQDPCKPCDPYGIAKLACEQHIEAFNHYYGGPSYTVFRPHNVFGPNQNIADPFRNVVGIFFRCAKQGLPFPVFGDGLQTRSFSYIDVVAKCIALSVVEAKAKNETFNVGGDQAMSILELASAIQGVTGATSTLDFLAPRKEVLHAHADHKKARMVFPSVFADAISIEEGLRLTAEHVGKLDIPTPTPCPAPIEIEAGLPPSWRM